MTSPNLEIRLTKEETDRFKKYSNLISASNGRFDLLTHEEQLDLVALLKKSMYAQGVYNDTELRR